MPPLPGRDLTITSDDLFFVPEFPRRLVLVGAGVIGLEMAGAFSDLGAAVTVIGSEAEILSGFDPDVAAYVRAILEARGVTFHLGASVTPGMNLSSGRSRWRSDKAVYVAGSLGLRSDEERGRGHWLGGAAWREDGAVAEIAVRVHYQ